MKLTTYQVTITHPDLAGPFVAETCATRAAGAEAKAKLVFFARYGLIDGFTIVTVPLDGEA